MISAKIMFVLLVFYFWLAVATIAERNYALTMYWIGALILNIAVLTMAYPEG